MLLLIEKKQELYVVVQSFVPWMMTHMYTSLL